MDSKTTITTARAARRRVFSLTSIQASAVLDLVRDAVRSDIPVDALRRRRRSDDLSLATLYAETVPDDQADHVLLSSFLCLSGQLQRS